MNGKASVRALIVVLIMSSVAVCYNSCSSDHGNTSGLATSEACNNILFEEFKKGYYPFLRTNCSTCHASGPGSGFFASTNERLSFNAFMSKGEQKVAEFATSTHKPPNTGTQHTQAINNLRASWAPKQSQFVSCQMSAGAGNTTVALLPKPTKLLVRKLANPQLNQTEVLTWNTGTDFVNSKDSFSNAKLEITVRAVQTSGVTAYQFENLRLINESNVAVHVRSLEVYVDGKLVPGETFLYVDRYVPNLTNNNSRRLSSGVAFYPSPIDKPVEVSLAVLEIGPADIDFQPVTYQQLTANGGIFQTNCASCHGTEGGLSLGPNNYNNIVGRTANSGRILVSPYSLMNNYLYQRMTDPSSPMPETGLLPKAQVDRVRDWILDGAPLNNQSIAR